MEQSVVDAAGRQDWEEVKRLVERGVDAEEFDTTACTAALHYAAFWGQEEICEVLLDKGANINSADDHGDRPLHKAAACEGNSVAVCKLLISRGANVSAVNHDGQTPLHLAADLSRDYPELCCLLMTVDSVNIADCYGDCPLHVATERGHTETVQVLVDFGADVNALNGCGQTPLHTAVEGKRCFELDESLVKWSVGSESSEEALHAKSESQLFYEIDTSIRKCKQTPLQPDYRLFRLCEILLRNGATADVKDEDGNQPLHLACKVGLAKIGNLLLSHGASTEVLNNHGQTPLHIAAEWRKDSKICEIVLEHSGAKIAAEDGAGNQPLHLACYQGCIETVKLLLSRGANISAVNNFIQSPLHLAAKRLSEDCPELCEILLNHGAKINAMNKNGNQPFHVACKSDHIKAGIVLLNHGPNVIFQFQNKKRTFAADFTQKWAFAAVRALKDGGIAYDQCVLTCLLYWAVYNGDQQGILLLLEFGANPNGLADDHNIYSIPLLHVAVSRRQDSPELSQLLIDHGSDVNAVDENGNHALHLSSVLGHTETVKWLLTHTKHVNEVNGCGLTPLLAAIEASSRRPRSEVYKALLQYGARTDAVDGQGNQALHLACKRGNGDAVKLLLSNRASLNAVNKCGQTPLHAVAISEVDCFKICKILLKCNANPNAVDKDGNQPLHLACDMNHFETGCVLLRYRAMTNKPNKMGERPLHIIAKRAEFSQVRMLFNSLLEHGARLDAEDKDGRQPLHIACENKNVVVGELLLSEEGDTTALDSNGKTPDLDKLLMAAVESGSGCTYVNACRVILGKGADPNYEGDNGAQPLMMAIEKQNVELCCLLLNRGASIPISHDEEPFHIGTDWKMTDLTRLLLSFGVDIRCARIGEQTVWERSKQSGTRDMACLLNAADSYPEEIVSQGEAAFQIYLKSCNEGSAVTVFLRIDVVGRDGVGKTSLVKSLTLQNFDQFELSTRGIAVYPNCQIIVKEACNWTTPLTRSDYRDIYDRNVIAIVADSFNKPKVRDEFFSSRVERRPMHLRIDPGNISAVKYPEYSPPNDMSMQQIDSGAVEAITSSDNSEEVQESMLQSISVATPKTAQQRSDAWSRLSGSLKIENQDKCEKFIPSAEKLSDEEVGHSQPSIPESTKNRIVQMLRNPESREKVKNEIVVTILDYAGHNVFYVTHQLCLSKEAFYYIVWDVSLPLDAITGSVFIFREGETVHNIILPSDETNYDRIEEWMSAIHIMEPSNSRRTILFEKVGIRSPAVFLVGTHADELKSEPDMLERQEKFLRDRLEGTVLAEHIVWASKDKMCFYVDNTLSNQQNGTVDKQVILLRQKTEEVARQMAQHHQVPITWLKFQQEVQELKESKKEKKAASVGELRQIAMESAGIGEEELFVLLRYLSNRSVLLYHPMAFNSNMDEEVVLDVEWLVTQLEKIITVQTAVPAILTSAVERCSEKGIMTVDLIKHLLQENGSARYQCLIMFFMGQFDLLCEYAALEDLKQADDQRDYVNLNPSTDHCQPKDEPHMQCKQTQDYHQAYFIPSLLQRPTVVQSLSVPVAVKRAPYLLLSSGRLRMPRPLFYRLLTRLCKRFRRLPRLYQNAGYFRVHYNHELEVVLNRFSLQLTVLTKHQTPLIPDVCCAVRNFMVSEVNEAKQLAMSGLELEMGFLHKVSCGSSKDVPEEFVSLEGYPTKRKRVYIKSIDMEINLPPDLKVWFPCTDELSVIGDPDGDQNSRLFPSPEVTQSTDVSVLLCGYQPHACLMEVARSLDKYDPMKDDWRRLWSHLTRRDGDVNLVKEQSESPTIYTLRMWCRMAPLKSATVGRLVAALSAIYRNDVASKLSGYIESACKNEETFSNTVAPQCCHDLTLVLPAVLECAAHRWYVIATEMGYSEGQITDMVSGIPEAADKLTKIVNCKKMSENSGIVADSLLKACGSIPNPVLAAVQEKMKCHQLTLK